MKAVTRLIMLSGGHVVSLTQAELMAAKTLLAPLTPSDFLSDNLADYDDSDLDAICQQYDKGGYGPEYASLYQKAEEEKARRGRNG